MLRLFLNIINVWMALSFECIRINGWIEKWLKVYHAKHCDKITEVFDNRGQLWLTIYR